MEQDIDYKGYKIRIVADDNSESPDEWGNDEIFLVYDHRQFMVERAGFNPRDIWEDRVNSQYGDYWAFPVEAYIHSGVTLSLYEASLTCRFDSSVTGFVLVKSKVESMAGIEFITESMAKERAELLLETWNQYLSGEVYGFIIEKSSILYSIEKDLFDKHLLDGTTIRDLVPHFMVDHDWEEVDSCWGYYGNPEDSGLIDEAKLTIDGFTNE